MSNDTIAVEFGKAFLTALLTILGWWALDVLRKRSQAGQFKAERDRDARQIVTPRRIQHLDELRAWLRTGRALWARIIEEKDIQVVDETAKLRAETIRQEVKTWFEESQHQTVVAKSFDPPELGAVWDASQPNLLPKDLYGLSQLFAIEVTGFAQWLPTELGARWLKDGMNASDPRIRTLYARAQERLEELVVKSARQGD